MAFWLLILLVVPYLVSVYRRERNRPVTLRSRSCIWPVSHCATICARTRSYRALSVSF
jgi:hypothetical protein